MNISALSISETLSNISELLLRCLHAGNLCRWLDKLGLGAALGLDIVMRQVLIGSGSYHLVDDNLDPLPVRQSQVDSLKYSSYAFMFFTCAKSF